MGAGLVNSKSEAQRTSVIVYNRVACGRIGELCLCFKPAVWFISAFTVSEEARYWSLSRYRESRGVGSTRIISYQMRISIFEASPPVLVQGSG